MANDKRNGLKYYLKVTSIVLGIVALAGALIATYIVGPVKATADRAEGKCNKNTEAIHDIEVDVAEIKKDTEDIPEIKDDLKRFMRDHGTPPTSDLPQGEHPADE